MTATAAYRSQQAPGRDGFAQALRAEWTKLRSVRGWVGGLAAAGLLAVLIGVLTAIGGSISCSPGPGGPTLSGAACRQTPPLGPGGDIVSDSFYFVHQTMTGDGSITARLTGLSGQYANSGAIQANPGPSGGSVTGLSNGVQPWSKAGIIIKADTTQGSPYVAMMVTGGNGVRMQYNFAHDIAGMAGQVSPAAPRWLRLTRTGDLITGYDSADGATWAKVGAVKLPGLPGSAPAGLFAASPNNSVAGGASFIGSGVSSGPTTATGAFEDVDLRSSAEAGAATADSWVGTAVGGDGPGANGPMAQGYQQLSGSFAVTGSGDIGPASGPGAGRPAERSLVGGFAGLVAIIVVAALFMTSEYRRGLIRVTLAASPRRGRVLAAKAVVVGVASFAIGLIAATVSLKLGNHLAYSHGANVLPISAGAQARLIVGTAAIFAVVAVFALALGALARRSAAAVTAALAMIVLPYILATSSVLPAGAAQWLARLTPAAGFAVQQSLVAWPQVSAAYTPDNGYFPLAPWVGLAVLCAWAAAALGLAYRQLQRRDA